MLLVEDDPDTAEVLEMSLEASGYDVIVAQSGRAALEMDLEPLDLVVSDIGLPDMTGHDLLRALHKTRKIPAIALSGYGTERDIRASNNAGFVSHLTKPVELDALVRAIQKAMMSPVKAGSAKRSQERRRRR